LHALRQRGDRLREIAGRARTACFRCRKTAAQKHAIALSSHEVLEERWSGDVAFGRDPAYGTSQDPIVRMNTAEVRKAADRQNG
jgi:hypothetical protein